MTDSREDADHPVPPAGGGSSEAGSPAAGDRSEHGDPLARAMTWLEATPAELVGLLVLLVGAVTVTAVVFWQAAQRPDMLPEAVAGPVVAADPGAARVSGSVGSRAGDPGEGHGADGVGGAGRGAQAGITVHVSGAVQDPGVVRVPSGARVSHAVSAAGGAQPSADLDMLNLARVLADGEQVHVPHPGEERRPPSVGTEQGDARGGRPIDLNTASREQLEGLPGIGPAKAAAIVEHRDEHGRFDVPGDLRGVVGIGERTFQGLADLVTVG